MQFHHIPLYASPGELWRRLKTVLLPLANPGETDCSCFESLSITVAALVLMPLAEHSEITCPGKTCCSLLELERRRNMLTRLMLSDPRFACCTNASCRARESAHPKKKADHGMQFHHVPLYASPGELWRRLKTVLLPLANPGETDCSCFESPSITVAALVLMPLAEHSEITCPGKTCCSLLELERRRNMLTRLMLSDPRFAFCTNASCWAWESTHPKKAGHGMQFHHVLTHVPLYAPRVPPGDL